MFALQYLPEKSSKLHAKPLVREIISSILNTFHNNRQCFRSVTTFFYWKYCRVCVSWQWARTRPDATAASTINETYSCNWHEKFGSRFLAMSQIHTLRFVFGAKLIILGATNDYVTGSTGKTEDKSSLTSWIYLKKTTKQHYLCKKIKYFACIQRSTIPQEVICTTKLFYYYYQNPSTFCFLMQIRAFVF